MKPATLAATLLAVGLLLNLPCIGADTAGTVNKVDGADDAMIRARLLSARPDLTILGIADSPMPGFVEVTLKGGLLLYVSADGQYMFAGGDIDIYRVTGNDLINLSEQQRAVKRRRLLDNLDESQMITFSPRGKTRATVTVFTDIDCGYCRKLHQEVPELNQRGIRVRYLAYPRAGIPSSSYDKIVSAWCSDTPQVALTQAKAGQKIPSKSCDNPIAEQYALGQEFGVRGTPALVLDDGRMVPGYVPAAELADMLRIN